MVAMVAVVMMDLVFLQVWRVEVFSQWLATHHRLRERERREKGDKDKDK